jgi:hypothetical protein
VLEWTIARERSSRPRGPPGPRVVLRRRRLCRTRGVRPGAGRSVRGRTLAVRARSAHPGAAPARGRPGRRRPAAPRRARPRRAGVDQRGPGRGAPCPPGTSCGWGGDAAGRGAGGAGGAVGRPTVARAERGHAGGPTQCGPGGPPPAHRRRARGDRNRQGDRGARDPRGERPAGAVRRGQLQHVLRVAARERPVRARARRVHRRHGRPPWPVPRGAGRDAAARRARRHAHLAAGPPVAGPRDPRGPARRGGPPTSRSTSG